MTILEAIREELRPYPVSKTLIEKKCVDLGVPASESYTFHYSDKVNEVVLNLLTQMVSLNNIGEGGVSISFNAESVNARIRKLCSDLGLNSTDYIDAPRVTYLGDI
jgi:hypothetical protein